MDFKRLVINNKAVSPVIGVILMVAITVILAAAIGSAVFGEGTAQPAPQVNLDIQAVGADDELVGTIRIEHLGGDPINFDPAVTRIVVSVDDEGFKPIFEDDQVTLGSIDVGSVKTLPLRDRATDNTIRIEDGDTANIKIIDIKTRQLICDRDLTF